MWLSTCSICKPVRMLKESIIKLHYLPDSVPAEKNNFKRYKDVYGTVTSEEFRPSLQKRSKCKTLPFSASIQHVKTVNMMLQCDECGLWRLL